MFVVPMRRESRPASRLLDDALDRFFGGPTAAAPNRPRSPALDLVETDRGYTVRLEMPGVAKEDVKVSIEGRRVTVQTQERGDAEPKDGERIVYRERSSTGYARTFTLAEELDQGEADAKLENGVLRLTLPKRSPRVAATITVG